MNVTAVAKLMLAPLIVTSEPAEPLSGEKLGIAGALMPVNDPRLSVLPFGVVTVTLPLGAVPGTVTVSCVSVPVAGDATVVPIFTTPPVRPLPLIASVAPAAAAAGVKESIFGRSLKPARTAAGGTGFVTVSEPVSAPAGTTALIEVAETTVIAVWCAPDPNCTSLTESRLAPLIVTVPPTGAKAGAKLVTVGAPRIASEPALIAVPFGVTTVILPLLDGAGT